MHEQTAKKVHSPKTPQLSFTLCSTAIHFYPWSEYKHHLRIVKTNLGIHLNFGSVTLVLKIAVEWDHKIILQVLWTWNYLKHPALALLILSDLACTGHCRRRDVDWSGNTLFWAPSLKKQKKWSLLVTELSTESLSIGISLEWDRKKSQERNNEETYLESS